MKEGIEDDENIRHRLVIGDDDICFMRINVFEPTFFKGPKRIEPQIKACPKAGVLLKDFQVGIKRFCDDTNEGSAEHKKG